jgi:ribosomal protein S18 acetylase RimI-like enzyme
VPRPATSTDFEGILRLVAGRVYPTWPSQDPRNNARSILEDLIESATSQDEYELFVTHEQQDITGFLILKKQLTRGITGDRESVVVDCFTPQVSDRRQLFECATEAARGYDSHFLTTEIPAEDHHEREFLESLGFGLEGHKISVTTAECVMPKKSPYSVRLATPDDGYLIGVLSSSMLTHTVSAGREYDLAELTFRTMGNMMAQVARDDPNSVGLVLMAGQELAGHLLLELNDRFGYIYDLALAKEHWGGTAVRHLMRSGSRLLFERRIPLFVGDVSASNRRALVVAQRALGFAVECQRYGLPL